VIMDEIGRGTSTRDGLAIAWAVCLYLLNRIRARTLFATHYHELTGIEHEAVKNMSMAVHDNDGQIVFLKRVVEGPSSNSYGIHVARLAGLPHETLVLAETILAELNRGVMPERQPPDPPAPAPPAARQALLFTTEDLVLQEIAALQPDSMTPLEALAAIGRWKKDLSGKAGT